MYLKSLLTATLVVACSLSDSLGQTVKSTVSIHTDRLPNDEKDYIANLGQDLTNLIDSHSWNDGKYRYALPIQVDLFFDKYSRIGSLKRYTAGLLISTRNGVQLRDKRWEFIYSTDYRLHFGEPYDSFTGLVEYCVNLCLGFEADRIAPLGGAPYYEKARLVGEISRSEAVYSSGWDDRRSFAFELTDTTYNSIRQARYYTEAGMYFAKKENWEQAEANLSKAVEFLLASPPAHAELHRGDYIFRFVDLDELVKAMRETRMKREIDQLENWDIEHPDRYSK